VEICGRLGKDLEEIMKRELSDYREYRSEFIIVEFIKRHRVKTVEERHGLYSRYTTVD
jgi:hypothetical protein